eukprot:2281941-Pleurochrysis_carterae.AAC.4
MQARISTPTCCMIQGGYYCLNNNLRGALLTLLGRKGSSCLAGLRDAALGDTCVIAHAAKESEDEAERGRS